MNTTTHRTRTLPLWSTVRDELRERRQAHSARRSLERELATYTTRADVDDLLALIGHQEGPDAEAIRTILLDNLRTGQSQHLLAS